MAWCTDVMGAPGVRQLEPRGRQEEHYVSPGGGHAHRQVVSSAGSEATQTAGQKSGRRTGLLAFRESLSPCNTPQPGASPGQKMWGGHAWRARGTRACNGVQGHSRAPGQEVRGQSSLKLKTF